MKRLLIILPYNPGDVVMGLITAERLKSVFPAWEIDFLASDETRELAEAHPLLHKVHVLPRNALKQARKRGDYEGLLRELGLWVEGLQAHCYDLSANLFQEPFGGVLQSLVNAREKIGLQLEERGRMRVHSRILEHLFAIPAARHQNPWHVIDLYVKACIHAMQGNGLSSAEAAPLAKLTAYTPMSWPGEEGQPEQANRILIHPGSAWAGKRWPAARWARLAQLLTEAGHHLLLSGAPEEKRLVDDIMAALPKASRPLVQNRAGLTSLGDMPALVRQCSLIVCGDTLTMHLAALTGRRCIALFGASNPVETGPYGPGHLLLQTEPPQGMALALASPHSGLTGITAESVADLILQGRMPGKIPVWETVWDEKLQAQCLVDSRQNRHPFQKNFESKSRLFEPSPKGRVADFPASLGAENLVAAPFAALLAALEKARQNPDARHLQKLEEMEVEFSRQTSDNTIWEAYRIALNGLPSRPLNEFLRLRQERLMQAISESGTYFRQKTP